jgi:hypothetical protein
MKMTLWNPPNDTKLYQTGRPTVFNFWRRSSGQVCSRGPRKEKDQTADGPRPKNRRRKASHSKPRDYGGPEFVMYGPESSGL